MHVSYAKYTILDRVFLTLDNDYCKYCISSVFWLDIIAVAYTCILPLDLQDIGCMNNKKPGSMLRTREYLMIYRGPGFLAVVHIIRLLAMHPSFPPSLQQVVSLSQSSCVSPVELTGGKGGRGAKSYDGEKTRPSINNSIISAEHWLNCVGETRWERTPVGETIPRIICDLRKWGISWGFLGFPAPFIEVNSLGAPSYIRTNTASNRKFEAKMYCTE